MHQGKLTRILYTAKINPSAPYFQWDPARREGGHQSNADQFVYGAGATNCRTESGYRCESSTVGISSHESISTKWHPEHISDGTAPRIGHN